MRKWNWSIFFVIILVSCIGALGNKSISTVLECLLFALCFGIPIGLLWAWMSKKEKKTK